MCTSANYMIQRISTEWPQQLLIAVKIKGSQVCKPFYLSSQPPWELIVSYNCWNKRTMVPKLSICWVIQHKNFWLYFLVYSLNQKCYSCMFWFLDFSASRLQVVLEIRGLIACAVIWNLLIRSTTNESCRSQIFMGTTNLNWKT